MENYGGRIFIHLIEGLSELKELGIIHRYLSPKSIYISQDFEEMKFFDF